MIPAPVEDVRTTRYLKSTPGALYRALTDGRLVVEWLRPYGEDLAGATVEPQPGGRFDLTRARAGATLETLSACVLEAKPGQRFAVTTALGPGYRPADATTPATLVLDLHEIASGTRLEATLMQRARAEPSALSSWDEGVGTLDRLASGLHAET